MRKQWTPFVAAAALALVAQPLVAQDQQAQENQTVIAILESSGNHATLLTAIRAAGLEETLNADGPFTIFAPTDEAFAKLPEGKLDELLADQEALRSLLTLHVAPRTLRSAEVTEPMNVVTLEGSSIEVEREGEMLRVRAPSPAAEMGGAGERAAAVVAMITSEDLQASNGVVHAIDTVLIVEN